MRDDRNDDDNGDGDGVFFRGVLIGCILGAAIWFGIIAGICEAAGRCF